MYHATAPSDQPDQTQPSKVSLLKSAYPQLNCVSLPLLNFQYYSALLTISTQKRMMASSLLRRNNDDVIMRSCSTLYIVLTGPHMC